MRYKRRPFTMLEALISSVIVLIALVPLMAPYRVIFREERRILEELEADRVAQLIFVDTLSKLLTKEWSFPPQALGERSPVDNSFSELLNYDIYAVWHEAERFYTVTYYFEPKQKEGIALEFEYFLSQEFIDAK